MRLKAIFILSFLVIVFESPLFSQQNSSSTTIIIEEIKITKTITKSGDINPLLLRLISSKELTNGNFIFLDSDSNKLAEGEIVNANQIGIWRYYIQIISIELGWSVQKRTAYSISEYPNKEIDFTNGKITKYWERSQIKYKEYYVKDGKLNGLFKEYFVDGTLSEEIEYVNNKKHGYSKKYSEEGKLLHLEHYENGKQEGLQYIYLEPSPYVEILMKNGKEISRKYFQPSNNN